MKTIKLAIKTKSPRNPLVAAALFKKAGSHSKSFKAQRLADKMAFKRDY